MWQFNNQMLTKTLVFLNSGQNLESDLIKIYEDLKPIRIGISSNLIFVEIEPKIDGFELLSQWQLNGLFEIDKGNQTKMSIEECQIIFHSLIEIRQHYCADKFTNSKQNVVLEEVIESQIQPSCSEQRQKLTRLIQSKDELEILQCNTIAIDIEDINEQIGNNATFELEQSIAINIGAQLQETNTLHEKDKQQIPDVEQNRKQDQQSFELPDLIKQPNQQETIFQKLQIRQQSGLIQYRWRKKSINTNKKMKQIKENLNSNQICFYILLLFVFVIILL